MVTRRSKREVEHELDGLDADDCHELGWAAALEWLDHVQTHGAAADSPAEYFGGPVTWDDRLVDFVEDVAEATPGADLSPAEVIGVRFCGEDTAEAVRERRRAERGEA